MNTESKILNRRDFLRLAGTGTGLALAPQTILAATRPPVPDEGVFGESRKFLTPEQVRGEVNFVYWIGSNPEPEMARYEKNQEKLEKLREQYQISRARKLITSGGMTIEMEIDPQMFFEGQFDYFNINYSDSRQRSFNWQMTIPQVGNYLTDLGYGVHWNPATKQMEENAPGLRVPFYITNDRTWQGYDNVCFNPSMAIERWTYSAGASSRSGHGDEIKAAGIVESQSLRKLDNGKLSIVNDKKASWYVMLYESIPLAAIGGQGKNIEIVMDPRLYGLVKSSY